MGKTVKITGRVYQEVEVEEYQLQEIFEKRFERLHGGLYQKDGKWGYDTEEHGGPHSWFEFHEVKKPTKVQLAAIALRQALYDENVKKNK